MRWARPVAWVAVVSLWLALGPLVLVGLVALLLVPRTGRRVRPLLLGHGLPSRRTTAATLVALGLVVGGLWVLPDGRLPVPPGGGAWVTPAYTGRPVSAQPLVAPEGPGDRSATPQVSDRPAPLGLSVEVDSAWFGAEHCAPLLPDAHDRLAALCTSRSGTRLKVVDPRTLRPVASSELPDPCSGAEPAPPVLDAAGNLLVATGDRRLLQVATADAADEPSLVTQQVVDLAAVVPAGDCVVAVVLDGAERAWFATAAGLVGVVAGDAAPVVLDLEEPVSQPLAADRDGVYVTTVEAVYRVVASASASASAPLVGWRTAYETGSGRKPGQRDAGSGSGAVLLEGPQGGLLAFTDNANPRMHVVVLRVLDGSQVCRTQVFEDDASATEAALVPVEGAGIVVTNGHGWTGPWRGALGRRPAGGIARVEATDCATTWTSPEVAPTSGATLSTATGLVYAWTKRRSWLGADAWYLTALDVRTGRTAWSARGGTGPWVDNDGGPVTIGPGGAAFVATRAGLVRIVDGTRGLRD